MKVSVGTFKTTEQTRHYIDRVLDTGRISYGPLCKELEGRFSKLHEANFGVLSNSGTSSLQVALQALKTLHNWRDGDEVIVPAVTFVASVNTVLHNNLRPVLVDVEMGCYGINTKLIEKAITTRTHAIMPVHLFGQPCAMQEIKAIADKYSLLVVEDSCETMFAKHKGKTLWGDIACYSLYIAHLITAGVGGIATTNNLEYAGVMRSLVNHGRDGVYISIDDNSAITEVVSRRFRFNYIGHSYRITELEAALALAQLDDWQSIINKRRRNAAYLTSMLVPLQDREKVSLPIDRQETEHSFMMYPILAKGDKWKLCNYLESNGIETREMMPITNQPCYSGMFDAASYPVANEINKRGFYVGCHQDLTNAHLEYIADRISRFYAQD